MGIVTSNSKRNVEKFLETHNLGSFDFIRGDSSLFGKAKVLKRLLKDLKISASESIYIGDETRDIEAAKAVHMKSVSVTWGYNSKEVLAQGNPDYLVEAPQELVSIFS